MGELGWEGCADEEILLFSCGLSLPSPGSPHTTAQVKPPPPRRETRTPCIAPLQTHPTKKTPLAQAKVLQIGQQLIVGPGSPPWTWEGGEGEAAAVAKAACRPPFLDGDESPNTLLGEQVYVPYTDGVYPGVVTSVVGGGRAGRVWVEHPGEKEMFRVERHLMYASHAAAVTHWEQHKAAAAGKKAAKAKKKPKPKPDADTPAEPAPKPAKPEPKPKAKQAPQPKPKAALEAAPMEVDAPAHPSAQPAAQPPAQTHD